MTRKTHINIGIALAAPLVTSYSYNIGYLMVVLIGAIDIIFKIKHRTWTHSILVLSISTMILISIDETIALFWFIGYLAHLLADSCTKMGVPFLYPFIHKRYGIRICKTGGVLDTILGYIALGIILYFAYKYVFNIRILI